MIPMRNRKQRRSRNKAIEAPIRLHDARLQQVASELKANSAKRVLDLGCGEGKLVRELLKDKQFEEIVGMDVSYRSLEVAAERLHLDTLPPTQKDRLKLMQGSLMYRDKRIAGFDAAAVASAGETPARKLVRSTRQ